MENRKLDNKHNETFAFSRHHTATRRVFQLARLCTQLSRVADSIRALARSCMGSYVCVFILLRPCVLGLYSRVRAFGRHTPEPRARTSLSRRSPRSRRRTRIALSSGRCQTQSPLALCPRSCLFCKSTWWLSTHIRMSAHTWRRLHLFPHMGTQKEGPPRKFGIVSF